LLSLTSTSKKIPTAIARDTGAAKSVVLIALGRRRKKESHDYFKLFDYGYCPNTEAGASIPRINVQGDRRLEILPFLLRPFVARPHSHREFPRPIGRACGRGVGSILWTWALPKSRLSAYVAHRRGMDPHWERAAYWISLAFMFIGRRNRGFRFAPSRGHIPQRRIVYSACSPLLRFNRILPSCASHRRNRAPQGHAPSQTILAGLWPNVFARRGFASMDAIGRLSFIFSQKRILAHSEEPPAKAAEHSASTFRLLGDFFSTLLSVL